MAPFQARPASLLPTTRHPYHGLPNHDCHTMRIPHYPPIGGQWVTQLTGERDTSTSSNARLSMPTPRAAAGGAGHRGAAVKVSGPKPRVVLAKCDCWVRATSEPGRGSQACCPGGIPRNRQCSPPQHARQASRTRTLWLVPVQCRPRTR